MVIKSTLNFSSPTQSTGMVIDIEKIFWAFWQSSFAYDYENDFVCLFDYRIKSEWGDPDDPISSDAFYFDGKFSLYKKFKMSNGKLGIHKTKPIFELNLKEFTYSISENAFKRKGIFECYEQYSKKEAQE